MALNSQLGPQKSAVNIDLQESKFSCDKKGNEDSTESKKWLFPFMLVLLCFL